LFEDAAVICVDCTSIALSSAAYEHSGYNCDTINSIVNSKITYMLRRPEDMYVEGNTEVGRRSPQPSSEPSCSEICRTAPFNVWFIDAVCTPLKVILQNGNCNKIVVLFYDLGGQHSSVAMSHLFAQTIPEEYRKSEEHLSRNGWVHGSRGGCNLTGDGVCISCFSADAERMRAAAERQVRVVMEANCFKLLQRPFVCKM
jgi:hypothetical protein